MITSSDIKALENAAVLKGITNSILMENAGKKVAEVIKEKFPDLSKKRILVVCYHGNNGGDGFVTARYLANTAEVEVLFLGEEERLKPDAKENLKRLEEEVLVQFIGLDFVDFDDYDLIIDAILGNGIIGPLKPILQGTINQINGSKAKKISIDIPSGLNPDTGEVHEAAIAADLVITFHDIKQGLEKIKDKVEIVDIGIPKDL